ncbi:MAG: transcriptional regulator [Planctomycetia bacterium 21-64-5]|nr:MAG: transcriptional regulator [Planctomycetia bacterium 21-64-5]
MHHTIARKLNLLLVDDDPSIVRLLTHIVERRLGDKLSVCGLTDAAEAIDWLERNCCDILVSDINMPDVDGLEMLRHAKQRNAWTQVIFITAHSTWEKLTEAVEYGASDYLLKPIDQDDFVSLLSQQYVRCARWQCAVLGTLEAAVG